MVFVSTQPRALQCLWKDFGQAYQSSAISSDCSVHSAKGNNWGLHLAFSQTSVSNISGNHAEAGEGEKQVLCYIKSSAYVADVVPRTTYPVYCHSAQLVSLTNNKYISLQPLRIQEGMSVAIRKIALKQP